MKNISFSKYKVNLINCERIYESNMIYNKSSLIERSQFINIISPQKESYSVNVHESKAIIKIKQTS